MIATRTPMAMLRADRTSRHSERNLPDYLMIGGKQLTLSRGRAQEQREQANPLALELLNIDSAPRTADLENP